MKKYTVNYSRKFPDHRITHDFKLYQRINSSPVERFRLFRQGFYSGFAKYPQIYLTVGMTVLFGLYTLPKVFNQTTENYVAYVRTDKTGNKWGTLSEKPWVGRFDFVHNRFQNEKGGIKDWADQN